MSLLTSLMNHPYADPLAWSLVHFLWQGAALALVAFLAIRWWRPSPSARYVIGVATLAAMLAAPAVTFLALASSAATYEEGPASAGPDPGGLKPAPPAVLPLAAPANPSSLPTSRPSSLIFIIAPWLIGVVILSIRLLGGWMVARRLVGRAVRPVTPEIHALARRVAGRLALDRIVRVVESSAVSVPVMVGWLKPVVLLPAAALSGLTPTQIEALLAHELAHVRRHDYLVNLLQSIVETLLFYHPAVWWVSRQVRADREHCCDDVAVGVCDRLAYVTALADLAAMRSVPQVALAATDGSLLTRVRRLLGRTRDDGESSRDWMSVVAVMLVAGALVPAAFLSARASDTETRVPVEVQKPLDGQDLTKPQTRVQQARDGTSTRQTHQGTGNFAWSNNGDKVAIKWTGAFRLADDDTDVVWVEAGKSVRVSDGDWLLSTGVEIKGRVDGSVERVYYRNGFTRAYEPEGRAFLSTALLKIVRKGFDAENRVARFLRQGGVAAVQAEIESLDGDHARRRYYVELFEQAKLSPAEVSKALARASTTIASDHELATLIVAGAKPAAGDEAALVALIDATKTIESDHEMRRTLSAVLPERPSPKVTAAVLAAAATIGSDYERASLLIAIAKQGGLTAATKAAFFDLVKGIRGAHEQGRVLRAVAAVPNLPEDILADAVKSAQTMSGDVERRQVLSASMARAPVTPQSAGGVIESAAAMRSDNERATLLLELVKKGGVTNETAPSFFSIVASMTSGYEQGRVLQAVLAQPAVSDAILANLLKAAGSVRGDYERAQILVAVAKQRAVTGEARKLYLAAADGIRSEHEQTRVLAQLVRSERIVR